MTTRSTPSDEISCHSFTLNVASRPFDWKDTKQSVYFVYFAFIINRHLSLILKHWIKDVSSAEQSSKEFFFIKSWWSFWTWGPDGRLEGLERCNCYIISIKNSKCQQKLGFHFKISTTTILCTVSRERWDWRKNQRYF